MAVEIKLPELGAGDEIIRMGCWLAEPGDSVIAGDRLIELVLPGMTFDVVAPASGTLQRIERPFESAVQPGDVLGWIDPDDGDRSLGT